MLTPNHPIEYFIEWFRAFENRQINIEKILVDLQSEKSLTKVNAEDEKFITISEAAAFLNVTIPSIYGMVHQSKIPVYRKQKRLLFLKSELMNFIKSGRRLTIQEIKDDTSGSY
jgi:excisionase family DNA binding protein